MKKLLALLLALCMLLSVAACAKDTADDDKDEKKDKVTQSQDDKDDKDDKDDADKDDGNDSLREGLNAYEYQGLRVYLGDEMDPLEDGYTFGNNMEISIEFHTPEEIEELIGETSISAGEILEVALDELMDEKDDAEILDSGKKNGVDFGYVTYDGEYYVSSIYELDGYFWFMNILFEDEDLVDTAIKYATICQIVGLPEEDDDQDYGDDEEDDDAIQPPTDVIATVENDSFVILVEDIKVNDFLGPTAKIYVENKSDKDLQFVADNAVADGLNVEATLFVTLEAGESCYDELYLSDPIPDGEKPLKFTDIAVTITVREEDNYTDPAMEEVLRIYPNGEGNTELYVRQSKDTDVVLLDNEYVTIYLLSDEADETWGYSASLYMVSKTDLDLEFTCAEAIVDGAEASASISEMLSGNCCCFADLYFYDEDFESLTKADEISMTIEAREAGDWFGDAVFVGTINISH